MIRVLLMARIWAYFTSATLCPVPCIVLTKVSKLFTQIMVQSKEAVLSLATHILQVGKTKN